MLNMPGAGEEKKRVALRVHQVLAQLGHSNLEVGIEWMSNARSAMGRAHTSYKRVDGELVSEFTLKFSEPLWPRATPAERETTIIHEVAHIVANVEAKTKGLPLPPSHGKEWQVVMQRAGVAEPKQYHNVTLADHNYVMARCGCAEPHKLTKRKAEKVRKSSARYICAVCKQPITLYEVEKEC